MRPWDPEMTAHLSGVRVHAADLPDGVAGLTDGVRVWVDRRLTAPERRCTIGHELVHIWAGHVGHQDVKVEAWVRRTTARLLLRGVDVEAAVRTEPSLWDAAETLHVTIPVLRDHLERIHPWKS